MQVHLTNVMQLPYLIDMARKLNPLCAYGHKRVWPASGGRPYCPKCTAAAVKRFRLAHRKNKS